jgi:hypothetical protein
LKTILVSLSITAVLSVVISIEGGNAFAQTNTTPQSQLDFAKIVADQYSTSGTPDIDVLYQNPHLLILRAGLDHFKSLGPILDLAISNGYNVTTATVFTIRSPGATADSPGVLTDTYTIFMSKK